MSQRNGTWVGGVGHDMEIKSGVYLCKVTYGTFPVLLRLTTEPMHLDSVHFDEDWKGSREQRSTSGRHQG